MSLLGFMTSFLHPSTDSMYFRFCYSSIPFPILNSILINYCCITNHPQFSEGKNIRKLHYVHGFCSSVLWTMNGSNSYLCRLHMSGIYLWRLQQWKSSSLRCWCLSLEEWKLDWFSENQKWLAARADSSMGTGMEKYSPAWKLFPGIENGYRCRNHL